MTNAIMERVRRLWGAVLCQACEDLEREEFNSYWYHQAAAFFLGGGEWAESRRTICDMLDLHPDDLHRPALRMINARRLEHGLPPLQPRPAFIASQPRTPEQRASPPVAPQARLPLPRLVATFNPPKPDRASRRHWSQRRPFNPFAPLPSEVKPADSAAD
jgi:hypothetical protein